MYEIRKYRVASGPKVLRISSAYMLLLSAWHYLAYSIHPYLDSCICSYDSNNVHVDVHTTLVPYDMYDDLYNGRNRYLDIYEKLFNFM